MKNKKERNRRVAEEPKVKKSLNLMDTPLNLLNSTCQIELNANNEAIIEGCTGILQYDEGIIRLSTSKFILKFTGRNLKIQCMTATSAIVEGFITAIEFVC